MVEHFEITEEFVEQANVEQARKEAFAAMMKEANLICPSFDSAYAEGKKRGVKAAFTAPAVLLMRGTDKQIVKAVVETLLQYKDICTGMFSSLPCIYTKGKISWYGQKFPEEWKREKKCYESVLIPMIQGILKEGFREFVQSVQNANEAFQAEREKDTEEQQRLNEIADAL